MSFTEEVRVSSALGLPLKWQARRRSGFNACFDSSASPSINSNFAFAANRSRNIAARSRSISTATTAPGPVQQFLRERSRAWPDFDHRVRIGNFPRRRHQPHEVLIDHEILPEPMARLSPRGGEEFLDLMLGLGHGGNDER